MAAQPASLRFLRVGLQSVNRKQFVATEVERKLVRLVVVRWRHIVQHVAFCHVSKNNTKTTTINTHIQRVGVHLCTE